MFRYPAPSRLSALSLIVIVSSGTIACSKQATAQSGIAAPDRTPNVLMICVDDLNDWVEPLGGHPQVQTPGMQALAKRGVVFTNTHCQSPLCNSSRTSLTLSKRLSTTGIYGLRPWFRSLPELKETVSLPQHFKAAGYQTYRGGMVYHGSKQKPADGMELEFDHWGPGGSPGIAPAKKLIPPTPSGNHRLIASDAHAEIRSRMQQHIPASMAPLAPGSAARILEKRDDGWYWENKKIDTANPPMDTGNSFVR